MFEATLTYIIMRLERAICIKWFMTVTACTNYCLTSNPLHVNLKRLTDRLSSAESLEYGSENTKGCDSGSNPDNSNQHLNNSKLKISLPIIYLV